MVRDKNSSGRKALTFHLIGLVKFTFNFSFRRISFLLIKTKQLKFI